MRRVLVAHPLTPPAAAYRLEAEFARSEGEVSLTFALTGEVDALSFAAPAAPERADGLWRTTCFEAFLQTAGEEPYVELNLAPSRRWAVWRFQSYREGGAPALVTPRLEVRRSAERFDLAAKVDISPLLSSGVPWRVGLTAVIEEVGGVKSYFALVHPSGKPDFHDPRGFALEAPA